MRTLTATIGALTLAATLALTGCAATGPESMPDMDHGDSDASTGADANDADVMFAQMMIPHHQQAIEMADVLLAKDGIDERVTSLAEQIKTAQQPEIDRMQGWLEDWGANSAADSDHEMSHGDGMMTEADMQALDDAAGTDASRLFLNQMILHHEGAVEMAESQIASGQNSDAVALARTIVEDQVAEIATMKDLLSDL